MKKSIDEIKTFFQTQFSNDISSRKEMVKLK